MRWPRNPIPRPAFRLPDFHMESVQATLRFAGLAAVVSFLFALVVPHVGVFEKLELTTQDVRLRLRGERPLDPSIALVEIDERSLQQYGNSWPLPRDMYALLLHGLRGAEVGTVGIDLLFVGDDKYATDDTTDSMNDALLAAVIARDSAVVNAVYFPIGDPRDGRAESVEGVTIDPLRAMWLRFTAPLPEGVDLLGTVGINFEMQEEIADSTVQVGHVSLYQDVDGVIRSIPLAVNHQGRMFPSLPLLMAAHHLGADWRQIRFARGHADLPTPRGVIRIPIDSHARMLVPFPGPRRLFQNHPNRHAFVDVMNEIKAVENGLAPADSALLRMRGAVALVCNTASTSAISDFGPTPFDVNFPLAYAHASVVNSILRDDFLVRIPREQQVAFWAIAALLLAFVMSTVSPIAFVVTTEIAVACVLLVGWAAAAFTGSLIEIVPPISMIGLLAVSIGARGYRLRDRQRRAQEQELAVAKKIQQELLPKGVLSAADVQVAGFNLPCYAVGGDYFDYFRLPDGRVALAIADVSGKGVPAALLMSNLQAILRAETARGSGVPEIPKQANRQLMESMSGSGKFITFFYAALDPETRRVVYTNAGHNPPLVVRADGRIEELETGGLLLGVFPFAEYEEGVVELAPGDVCVLFTDGVTEAENRAKDLYGDPRLQEHLVRTRGRTAEEISNAIADDVAAFSRGLHQSDDVTVIVVKVA